MDWEKHEEQERARLATWITPADEVAITEKVRKDSYGLYNAEELAGRTRAAVRTAAREMDESGRDLALWLLRGARQLGEGMFADIRISRNLASGNAATILAATRSAVVAKAAIIEHEWAEDEGYEVQPWQRDVLALVRRWNEVTAYTLLTFSRDVWAKAHDALAEDLDDILDDNDEARGVARATRKAVEEWVKEWEVQLRAAESDRN